MSKRLGFAALWLAALSVIVMTQCSRDDTGSRAHDHPQEHDEHEHHEERSTVTMMPDVLRAHGVVIARSGPGVVRTEIDLPGEVVLNADRVAHIVPRFPGVVQQVNKALGDVVHAGDVLAIVQSNVSAAPYDVVSMVDGTVIEKHVALGEFVRDDADIFVVADLSTVWINISVYARFLTDVRRGQRVRIASPGVDATTTATIDYVGPIVGESTRTGVARVVLANPDRIWQPGLFVTAHIAVSEAKVAVAVPDGAVQTLGGQDVVFVRRMNEFTARPVVVGRRGGEMIEIVEGLAPGEDYVADGSFIFKAELGKSEAAHEH